MKQIPRSLSLKRVRLVERTALSLGMGFLCVGVFVGRSVAEPPQTSLDPPFYSFDAESPTIDPLQDPVTQLHADDILMLTDQEYESPIVAVPGAALGLGLPGDELDALSSGNTGLDTDVQFLLLFSVDRASTALVPSDPFLVESDVPHNASEQAEKGHASGDQFMALDEFTRAAGSTSGDGGARAPATSVQLRNQYNEGGSDFGGEPTSGSRSGSRSADGFPPQDNVVSMMLTGRSASAYENGLTQAYFSVKGDSPSLLGSLPGGGETATGAHIFYYDADVSPPEDRTTLFASSSALGLTPADDIDAMIVFDTNGNHVFDGSDRVLFSLAPTSASLRTIEGAGPTPAADVFAVSADGAGPLVFANADNLGLEGPDDNVDALDYVVCVVAGTEDPNARECALEYGIRGNPVPAVSDWGLVVLTLLVMLTGAIMIRRRSRRVA